MKQFTASFLAAIALAANGSLMFGQNLTTLASFSGFTGDSPATSLIADTNGNLYGTTFNGGATGNGMIFKVNIAGRSMTVLAPFGSTPPPTSNSGVIADADGNFWGATTSGGNFAAGTVFEYVAATQTLSTVASFNSATTGYNPQGGVAMDASGNLYGTTQGGPNPGSTIFEYSAASQTLSTLVTVPLSAGGIPHGVIMDAAGNLYGTAQAYGAHGLGTVFKYSAATHSVAALASFDGTNGANPSGGLLADTSGNLYGTTYGGGANGMGKIFEYSAATHSIITLASFNGADGSLPVSALVMDASGNLYGTAQDGGAYSHGTVFELSQTNHTLTALYSFNVSDGGLPTAGLLLGADGNLYGTTQGGGPGDGGGTVFELSLPEPGSLSVVGMAALAICRRRRGTTASPAHDGNDDPLSGDTRKGGLKQTGQF